MGSAAVAVTGGAAEPNRRTFGVEVDQRRQPYVDGLPPSKENGPSVTQARA